LPSIQIANAQDVCQDGAESIIGSDDQSEYEAERVGGRLYLNIDNPAQCSGLITELEYCYYPPESDDESRIPNFYQVYFAIYRQQETQYRRQTIPVITLGGFASGLDEDFSCTTRDISIFRIQVQQGDIIGVCLPGRTPLDVVSVSDEEHSNAKLSYIESGCSSSLVVPFIVNERITDVRVQESRILHLYARITSKLYNIMPTLDDLSISQLILEGNFPSLLQNQHLLLYL
jgi:hypothetical protein